MAIIIPIGVDTSGLKKLNTAGSKLRAFGKIAAVAAGAAALGGLVKTLQIGTEEFMEQQKVVAQTNAVLKSTNGIAKVTSRQIENLAGALMLKSGVDDEAIQSGQNLLLTFTNIRNEVGKNNDIFNQATVATLDLSVAMGKDMQSSAILVGKALNDPIKGATALSRAGVQLTEQQKNQIRAFVESGRVMEAQKIILAELTTQFGGSAEAAGKTLPGQLAIARESFRNLAGELASTFLPGLATAATALVGFLRQLGQQPTFAARVKLIVTSIGDISWRGISSLYEWWTKQGRAELPARVILTPSGKMQFDQFFTDLERRARAAGIRAGRATVNLFFGIFTSEGRDAAGKTMQNIGEKLAEAGRFWFRITGTSLLIEFVSGFVRGGVERLTVALRDMVGSAVSNLLPDFTSLGGRIRKSIFDGFARRGPVSLANIITDQVKEAIQGARQTLQGAAGTLGGLVGEIIGGSSPEAKRLREIRAQQQREAREREDARLREAVANAQTTDERAIAERDLQSFLLEQEAIRLEESIQQNQEAANKNIANLVEEFNRGLISADVFSARLNEIIGADRGAELGLAFAGAFDRELQTILNTARDIFSVIGTGETIAGATGAGVSTTLKAENERRFQEALADWQKRRDALTQRLERATDSAKDDDSPGGKSITDAEKKGIATIRNLIEAHKKRRPNRGAYGLALGGILKQPTFVAGEAGKEAVIPLESSSAMDILRQAVGGGGGSTQVINLTVNAGLGTNPDELSRVIVDSIKYYERRNGQVFTGPLVPTVRTASGSLVQAASSGPTDFNRISQRRRG